jgi:hypothetical protein
MNAPEMSFFAAPKSATTANDGTLNIDKSVIAARVKAAPGVGPDDEGMLARILESIRRFITSILRTLGLAKSSPVSTQQQGSQMATPSMRETADSLRVDGLPKSALDRMRMTVDEIVNVADGTSLSDSLRASITSMPEIRQKQVLRVLLQQNTTDTLRAKRLEGSLTDEIHRMLGPVSASFDIEPDAALALLRADLTDGGGSIASVIDPDKKISPHVTELQKVDSALAGLALHRGSLCTLAMDSGAYTREELSTLGIDASFLADLSAKGSHDANTVEGEPGETVADLRQQRVGATIIDLVSRRVFDAEDRGDPLLNGAAVDAALSSESAATNVRIGVLLAHGKASYKHGKDALPSYFVRYRDDAGIDREVWGVDLERAMGTLKPSMGERISLVNNGRVAVEVPVPVIDARGNEIGREMKTVHRNEWIAENQRDVMSDSVGDQSPDKPRVSP